jgi:K+-transporting ATPase ATPase A chain
MTIASWLQIAVFVAIVGLLTRPLGGYLARIYAGERAFLHYFLGPVETALYRLAGIKPEIDQTWYEYAASLLVFHLLGTAVLCGGNPFCRSTLTRCQRSPQIWR